MSDPLRPATADEISLASAIQPRFLDICDLHLRLKGEEIQITEHITSMMKGWRTSLLRFTKGDFRISDSEATATRDFAQWTVDVHMELRNQKPKKIEWT